MVAEEREDRREHGCCTAGTSPAAYSPKLTAVRELVSVQQQQLAVLQQQLVQQAQQRPVASPASFTAKLPEFTGAGRVDLWACGYDVRCEEV